jgi:hypothetical protein
VPFLKEPSEEAKVKIYEFFLKTSVPRILAENRLKGGGKVENQI